MPVVNGIIQAPVSIADVQSVVPVIIQGTVNGTVMRIISGDVGVLCSAKAGDTFRAPITVSGTTYSNVLWTVVARVDINIWAKFKPVHLLNKKETQDQWDAANSKWKNSATWMHGSPLAGYATNKYGLAARSYGTIEEVIAKYGDNDPMNGWVYNRPLGGSSSPYRLTDFAGYAHGASDFADNFFCGAVRTNPGNLQDHSTRVTATFMFSPETDYAINPENILGEGSYYFGVILVKGNSKFYFTGGNKTTVSEVISLDEGTYIAYPFFSTARITYGQSQQNGTYYTIPMLSPVTVQVSSNYNGGITVNAKYRQLNNQNTGVWEDIPSDVYVNIVNTVATQREVYFTLNYGSQTIRVPEVSGTITLPANGTISRTVRSSAIVPYYGSVTGTLYWQNGGVFNQFSFLIAQNVSLSTT